MRRFQKVDSWNVMVLISHRWWCLIGEIISRNFYDMRYHRIGLAIGYTKCAQNIKINRGTCWILTELRKNTSDVKKGCDGMKPAGDAPDNWFLLTGDLPLRGFVLWVRTRMLWNWSWRVRAMDNDIPQTSQTRVDRSGLRPRNERYLPRVGSRIAGNEDAFRDTGYFQPHITLWHGTDQKASMWNACSYLGIWVWISEGRQNLDWIGWRIMNNVGMEKGKNLLHMHILLTCCKEHWEKF